MNTGTAVTSVAALLTLALAAQQLVNVVKYAKVRDWNGVVTPVVYTAIAFGLLTLAAHAKYYQGMIIPGLDVPIGAADWQSILITSIGAFGVGGFLYDRTKARDNNQDASTPSLVNLSQPPAE